MGLAALFLKGGGIPLDNVLLPTTLFLHLQTLTRDISACV